MESELSAEQQLARFFRSNGYLRLPNLERRGVQGSRSYKKGYEIRLVASSEDELEEIRSLLKRAGFNVANSHVKGTQWIQPIYGRVAVQRLCRLSGRVFEIESTEKSDQSTIARDTALDASEPEQVQSAEASRVTTHDGVLTADLARVEVAIRLCLRVFTGQSQITLSPAKCQIWLALSLYESR